MKVVVVVQDEAGNEAIYVDGRLSEAGDGKTVHACDICDAVSSEDAVFRMEMCEQVYASKSAWPASSDHLRLGGRSSQGLRYVSVEIPHDGKPRWYRRRDGMVVLCVFPKLRIKAISINVHGTCQDVHACGTSVMHSPKYDIVEHLPDCDGFDWKPLKPMEVTLAIYPHGGLSIPKVGGHGSDVRFVKFREVIE